LDRARGAPREGPSRGQCPPQDLPADHSSASSEEDDLPRDGRLFGPPRRHHRIPAVPGAAHAERQAHGSLLVMEGRTPMSCGDDLKTLLSRYVDGELSSAERTRVDEHLVTCAPCRELLQIFQKNESLLSNALSTESFGNTVIEAVLSEIKSADEMSSDGHPVVEAPEVSR